MLYFVELCYFEFDLKWMYFYNVKKLFLDGLYYIMNYVISKLQIECLIGILM